MNLRAERRLAIAPNFHLRLTWTARLLIVDGTRIGEPCLPWREPTAAELALLVLDEAGPRDALRDCLCLFQIPAHLRSAFWAILEQFGELPPDRAERFFLEVGEFLDFKNLPVPPRAVWEVTAGKLGSDESSALPIWGAINLGDEPTAIVFVNLSADETRALSLESGPDGGSYPCVQIQLEPGEGYRLPVGGVPMIALPSDEQQLDVMLVIRTVVPTHQPAYAGVL